MKLAIGDKAPEFTLQNTEGEAVSLADLRGDGNLLLLFFPLAFSSTCVEELCTTRDNMKLYKSLDARVAGISVDSFFTLREFKKAENLSFTLLSDFNKEVSKRYGALYEDFFGMRGVSKRASFVIGKEGTIKYHEVLEDSDKLPDFHAIQQALNKA